MATTPDFKAWAAAHQQRIESQLQAVLPSPEVAPQRLHEAMRYAALGGGKRVRPLLAFAAAEITAADPEINIITRQVAHIFFPPPTGHFVVIRLFF